MKKILIGIVLVLSTLTVGCTRSMPKYQFSCENHRAIDAGFCDDPNAGVLVGGLLHGDYYRDN